MQTEFVITDGTRYMKQNIAGRFKIVSNITMADTYESKTAAVNVIKNSLTKAYQRQFYVAQVVNGELVQCTVSAPPKAKKKKSGKHYNLQPEYPEVTQWYTRVQGLENLFEDAQQRNKGMSQSLSDLEGAVQDILHFIEFSSLGASDGFKVYKLLRDTLRRRRSVKNEQRIIGAINNNCNAKEAANNILSTIKELQEVVYEPRVLDGLFTDGLKAIER